MNNLMSIKADDPVFLIVGAASFLFILFVLYEGGWKLVTHVAVKGVVLLFNLAIFALILAAAVFWLSLVFAEPQERAVNFLRAVTSTATILAVAWLVGSDNVVTRFLNRCRQFLTFPEADNA